MALDDTLAQQDHQLESEVSKLLLILAGLLHHAQTNVLAQILPHLDIVSGRVASTAGNRLALRKIDVMLQAELKQLGFENLVSAFVQRFGNQVGWFTKVLESTPAVDKVDFAQTLSFTADQKKNLSTFQMDAAAQLEEIITAATQRARVSALLGVGGSGSQQLAGAVTRALDSAAGPFRAAAANNISVFYRTVAELSYQNIEADNGSLLFKYVGPPSGDPVIRPFCQRIMKATEDGEVWTRDAISKLDNGQAQWGMGNVFICGGGFNCRHQWVVAAEHKTLTMGAAG